MFTSRSLALAACLVASLGYGAQAASVTKNKHDTEHLDQKGRFKAAEGTHGWVSPEYTWLYEFPLPIPPLKDPVKIVQNPLTGKEIWYYELEIKPFAKQIYPNLGPAEFIGYDGISPGPTFYVPVGTETVVRVLNNSPNDNSVHLHGSPSRAPFDGWTEDLTSPGEYKDYYWPNYQKGQTMWYHDHAFMRTAENAYFGQAGAYLLHNPSSVPLGLPSGYGEYDIPLILSAKFYNKDGTLKSTLDEKVSVWGDIIQVNGQPWPYFDVEPRKYRLRFLNSAVSRDWDLYFVDADSEEYLSFQVTSSDSGLLGYPVSTTSLYLSPGERYSIVIDFSKYAGRTIDLRNILESNGAGKDTEYPHTDKVMRFFVKSELAKEDTSRVPSTLRQIPMPPKASSKVRHFKFERKGGKYLINGVGFADIENRVLARPPVGTVETWVLENHSNGWTHPVHVHLVDLRVISRSGGRNELMPYETAGLKDVVWLGRGETVTVEAHYLPWTGVYMFHCHNLIHEDHDMMAVFNVTALNGLGYDEKTDFADPMDPRWRAVRYHNGDFASRTGPFSDDAIVSKIDQLARQEPYSQLDEALAAVGGK
ncbi:Bilirubin oxidase [Paramyrothecium foliicola]|nr:Bilirubin oxidase [Paramyrothecium foliicola]